jgi:hypothetical protein
MGVNATSWCQSFELLNYRGVFAIGSHVVSPASIVRRCTRRSSAWIKWDPLQRVASFLLQ